ncbi:MAG TPA: TlpA disulfide reductase family protein [Steroidobacteraceae bacterium]|nr:TlpA disulfide reductase family protein [Steroidobacteraceae bacterium]
MGPASRWSLVLLLAIAAGAGAWLATRSLLAPDRPAASALRAPAPVAQPDASGMPPLPVIPDRRPEVTLADRDGKLRSLSEWNGKPQVINFWATWCAPCRREIPMLNALASDGAWPGIALIGVAIDFREDVLEYLEETPIQYPVLIGEQDGLEASRAFGMASLGLPYTVFVDSRGRIVTIHLGELHRPQADAILSVVQALDAGKIDMAEAKARIKSEVPKIG